MQHTRVSEQARPVENNRAAKEIHMNTFKPELVGAIAAFTNSRREFLPMTGAAILLIIKMAVSSTVAATALIHNHFVLRGLSIGC